MFSHATVGTTDFTRACSFYDAALAALGLKREHTYADEGWAGYLRPGTPGPMFWFGKPINGEPATFGNGVTIAFNAETRAQVDAFHAAALKTGGTDEGAPGLRAHYHPNYYGAYVRDPDGNKLCCVCHLPQ